MAPQGCCFRLTDPRQVLQRRTHVCTSLTATDRLKLQLSGSPRFASSDAAAAQPIWRSIKATGTGKGVSCVGDAENHTIRTDEPVAQGGRDEAATPLHTLLVALMGCETATAHFTAKRLGIKIDSLSFEFEGVYDLRGWKAQANVPARFQTLKGVVTVETNGTQADVEKLQQMVYRVCPVASLFIDAGVSMQVAWKKK